ncbi:hypothetical protein TNCV_182261 [Trichonephila clavipes]|nr:hypothetical protein TNCV_182261 [Trichonephila clavipes]
MIRFSFIPLLFPLQSFEKSSIQAKKETENFQLIIKVPNVAKSSVNNVLLPPEESSRIPKTNKTSYFECSFSDISRL